MPRGFRDCIRNDLPNVRQSVGLSLSLYEWWPFTHGALSVYHGFAHLLYSAITLSLIAIELFQEYSNVKLWMRNRISDVIVVTLTQINMF